MQAISSLPPSTSLFARHQALTIRRLEGELGLTVHIRDDMLELVRTYAALTETGYVQLPFMLERPVGEPSPHFWVHVNDGPDIVAMAGLRVMANGDTAQSCGDFFAGGGLYPPQGGKAEPYLRGAGPWLEAGARFGYLGAGWVHARWRGHAIAGYISRIINAESALRSGGSLAFQSCLTFHPMYAAGLNLRANCWHHMHAELVLEGHLAALGKDVKMYMSHATRDQQAALYALELKFLEFGLIVPWMRPHDDTTAPSLLLKHAAQAVAA
jgi:hypothetical protein